jgi:pyruvate-formate lyase
MKFREFQNQSRLYVIGALEPEELEEFERERKKLGKKAEDFVTQCYALHEAFALSLRSAKTSAAIKERLMSIVRERQQMTNTRNTADVALMTPATKLTPTRSITLSASS